MADDGSNDDEMTAKLMSALLSEQVSNHYKQMFEGVCDKKIKEKLVPINNDIAQIRKDDTARDEKIQRLELKIDTMEQEKKCANLIISGLENSDNPMTAATNFLKNKMQIDVNTGDIKNAFKFGKPNDQNKPPIKVVFASLAKRNEVYRKRITLKNTNVYVNEDLTPMRSELLYLTRQFLKTKPGARTWSIEGKIFAKLSETGKPLRISDEDDLLRMRTQIQATNN